jgi:hypothetical protein
VILLELEKSQTGTRKAGVPAELREILGNKKAPRERRLEVARVGLGGEAFGVERENIDRVEQRR